MRIDIISAVPELMSSFLSHSIVKRAINNALVEIHFHDLRAFGIGKFNKIDDYPYGGESGMILSCEPLAKCISSLRDQFDYDEIIYLTPDAQVLKQAEVNRLSLKTNLMMICGHYKGIDQRIRDEFVTLEISIGDYVLSGGEIAACVLTDSIIRLIPGALGDEMSALSDSFQDSLLSYPVYTRPKVWRDREVPEVLLSGDHKKIDAWRHEKALEKTKQIRPDLLG